MRVYSSPEIEFYPFIAIENEFILLSGKCISGINFEVHSSPLPPKIQVYIPKRRTLIQVPPLTRDEAVVHANVWLIPLISTATCQKFDLDLDL